MRQVLTRNIEQEVAVDSFLLDAMLDDNVIDEYLQDEDLLDYKYLARLISGTFHMLDKNTLASLKKLGYTDWACLYDADEKIDAVKKAKNKISKALLGYLKNHCMLHISEKKSTLEHCFNSLLSSI